MVFVVVGPQGGFLDGAVHALDLAVGPKMVGFGHTLIDVVAGTGDFEGMRADEFSALQGGLDVRRGRPGRYRGK